MIKIKDLLVKETANEAKLEQKLAEIAGCSVPTLNTFKMNEKKEMKEFSGLIKVIRHLRPEREFELMVDYSQQINPNFQTARYMLEYLDANGLVKEKNNLINRMLECKNAESKTRAKLYQLDQQVMNKEVSPFEAINMFLGYGGKLENKVAAQIFSAYVYLDQKLYTQVLSVVDGLTEVLPELEDTFLENMYMTRLLLLKAEAYNRTNEVIKSREYSQQLLDMSINQTYRGWAFLQLGNSYLLSDYDKAKGYLEAGLKLENIQPKVKNNIKRSHNFMSNVWKKQCQFLDHDSQEATDIHEVAFSFINKGDLTKGNDMLNTVSIDECTKNELAFHYYLKGLVSNSMTDYTESIKYFNQSGDSHFKLLPVMKLKQFGVDESIIELLIN